MKSHKSSPYQALSDNFCAMHVSPDGRDMVATTSREHEYLVQSRMSLSRSMFHTGGWVVFIPDFLGTNRNPNVLGPRPKAFRVKMVDDIAYLAFDGKRILVAIVRSASRLQF